MKTAPGREKSGNFEKIKKTLDKSGFREYTGYIKEQKGQNFMQKNMFAYEYFFYFYFRNHEVRDFCVADS